MNQEIINSKPASSKVMLLAVHHDADGKIVITPIDVEHEVDDQSDLTASEHAKQKGAVAAYRAGESAVQNGLDALFTIFDQRLYREQFRNFENFCFSIFGTHRIAEAVVTKAKAKVKKLHAELEEAS